MNERHPKVDPVAAWQSHYADPALQASRRRKHRHKLKALGLLDIPRDAKILDVACGEGEMLDILAQAGFRNLSGLDMNELLTRGDGKRSWRFFRGSALRMPFEENAFDWILCAHALHHLPHYGDIAQLLQEARRCLKPGGRLALIDHYDSPWLRLAFGLLRSPLALVTPWSRAFRKQLLAEAEPLGHYLRHAREAEKLIRGSDFSGQTWRKALFFFYFTGEKAA